MGLPSDFVAELRKRFAGDIRLDSTSRTLYSTDASIYQIEPLGVLIPRTEDDLQWAVELAARFRVPVLARGAGTSLAGQAIGPAIILDCSRWLDQILSLDSEARTVTLQPGVILEDLNRAAALHGLQFGPDPASAERATVGGVVANNGTGAHSIRYGMTADHIRSADVVLADGSRTVLGEVSASGGATEGASRYDHVLRSALKIRTEMAAEIRTRYPRSWRSSAGYRLNCLLGWAPTSPPEWGEGNYPGGSQPGQINLAQLLAGSEGTLAVMQRITLGLVPKPAHAILAILQYPSLGAACDAVPGLLATHPSAIELISQLLLRLARNAPAAAGRTMWLRGDPEAVVVVEFSGDSPSALRQRAAALGPEAVLVESQADQADVWAVRKLGLGFLDSQPRPARPISFVEDCAIPVDKLGAYVRGMESIMTEHGAQGGIYGHASAGCLHIRPVLDLRTEEGRRKLRSISAATAALALDLQGSMTSEHGDGLARAEWLPKTYGPEIVAAMRDLKLASDPDGILNPGKKLEAGPIDRNLRYGPERELRAWSPGFDFTRQGGLALAVERCNGQGVCRKASGVMCPSFQAVREEMHSTRGRANLLRALVQNGLPGSGGGLGAVPQTRTLAEGPNNNPTKAVFEALDLCLGCKACSAECPSGVDMAALKAEFLRAYYESHARPLRDYVFGYFHVTAGLLSSIASITNAAARFGLARALTSGLLGIASQRPLPRFAIRKAAIAEPSGRPEALFLRDPFNHFIDSQVEQAAFDLLDAAGFDVRVINCIGAGASLISKGFFKPAQAHAARLLAELEKRDPEGVRPLVAIEPSELSALKHDYASVLPGLSPERRARLARVESVESLLNRNPGWVPPNVGGNLRTVNFHPHCHQKAQDAEAGLSVEDDDPSLLFLRRLGFHARVVPAGCCGMAGTFGYESEHYDLSQQIGGLTLFGWVKAHPGEQVAATGAACRMQISQGTGVEAEHPLVLAVNALRTWRNAEAAPAANQPVVRA